MWLGSPSIYVFDCSAAGLVLHWFNKFSEQREAEAESASKKLLDQGLLPPSKLSKEHILLGACGVNEVLPTTPDLPSDIFTACLTTPIKIALKWFCTQTIISGISSDLIDKLPGRPNDRRTPMGELNWIFTAITDTIAWNVLPQKLFQKLFREDLLVASLFRNYLLAERIMRSCKCTPVSYPRLPPTYNHPMWQVWDLVADHCLSQLNDMIDNSAYEYKNSTFFTEQLTAFEVWLEFGSETKKPPEQLPIVLQVLLSQQHRQRALELLAKFLDLGPWAVNQALSVGIFPYVLKLLQSPASELREVLVFIWAKILALDLSCQFDLVKDKGQQYFINILADPSVPSEQRQQVAFILSAMCNNCRPGQSACLDSKFLQIALSSLSHPDPNLRRWIILCIGKFWENYDEGKREAIQEKAHIQLCGLLTDPSPEVRAATVYAIGTFISRGPSDVASEPRTIIELNLGLTLAVVISDASHLVRKELVVALSSLINSYEDRFKQVELKWLKAEVTSQQRGSVSGPSLTDEQEGEDQEEDEDDTIFEYLWKLVSSMANDPYPLFAQMTNKVVGKIKSEVRNDISKFNARLPQDPKSEELASPSRNRKARLGFLRLNSNPAVGADNVAPLKMNTEEIRSTLYEWSCLQFSQPILFKPEDDETGPDFCERKWQLQRNTEVVGATQKLRDPKTVINTLDHEIAILENNTQMISQLCFHPFEDILFVSDEYDGINIWDWQSGYKMNTIHNQNPFGSRITSLTLLNENDSVMVAAGSDEGVVRIWGGLQDPSRTKLVTAWRVLGDLAPVRGYLPGLVLEWQKKRGLLMAAGNADILKLWDVHKELVIQDIPSESPLIPMTSLTSNEEGNGCLFVAGAADGAIRLFDRRQGSKYAMVGLLNEHKGWVINLSLPPTLNNQLISGAGTGDVKIWDLRNTKASLKTIVAHPTPNMSAFCVHNYSPLFAVGSPDQRIRVMKFDGTEASLIRYHDGFLGQRIGPISALQFHPYRVMLGAGATDSIISVYEA